MSTSLRKVRLYEERKEVVAAQYLSCRKEVREVDREEAEDASQDTDHDFQRHKIENSYDALLYLDEILYERNVINSYLEFSKVPLTEQDLRALSALNAIAEKLQKLLPIPEIGAQVQDLPIARRQLHENAREAGKIFHTNEVQYLSNRELKRFIVPSDDVYIDAEVTIKRPRILETGTKEKLELKTKSADKHSTELKVPTSSPSKLTTSELITTTAGKTVSAIDSSVTVSNNISSPNKEASSKSPSKTSEESTNNTLSKIKGSPTTAPRSFVKPSILGGSWSKEYIRCLIDGVSKHDNLPERVDYIKALLEDRLNINASAKIIRYLLLHYGFRNTHRFAKDLNLEFDRLFVMHQNEQISEMKKIIQDTFTVSHPKVFNMYDVEYGIRFRNLLLSVYGTHVDLEEHLAEIEERAPYYLSISKKPVKPRAKLQPPKSLYTPSRVKSQQEKAVPSKDLESPESTQASKELSKGTTTLATSAGTLTSISQDAVPKEAPRITKIEGNTSKRDSQNQESSSSEHAPNTTPKVTPRKTINLAAKFNNTGKSGFGSLLKRNNKLDKDANN